MNKNILVTALVSLLLGGIVGFVVGGNNNQPQAELGSGTRFPNGLSADSTAPSAGQVRGTTLTVTSTAGITGAVTLDGGTLYSSTFATTSTGAGTLTAANITGVDTILSTNAGALTLTLPASTTLSNFVPTVGDLRRIVIVNQGTALLTLAGGTGTLLQTASSTKAVNIGGTSSLECVRKTNTDVVCLMSPGI